MQDFTCPTCGTPRWIIFVVNDFARCGVCRDALIINEVEPLIIDATATIIEDAPQRMLAERLLLESSHAD